MNVIERIPTLVANLAKVSTVQTYEQKYIGEAMALLLVLLDMLEKE